MARQIEVMSVADLLTKKFPPTDSMLGGNLIDRGGALLISGPQKIGKSLFATQLALCLAGRVPFVGFNPGDRDYRTLILQAEVSEKRMQERFLKQVAGFPREALDQVFNACVFSSIKLDDEQAASTAKAWVQQVKPDLLIIDPLTNFHTGDENASRDVARVTTVLDDIRSEGVAVGLVHHHGKSSAERTNVGYKSRGSSVLPGWYDSHFSLEWAEAGHTVRLRFELRNGECPEDVILRLNPDTLLFEEQTDEAAQITLVVSAVRELGTPDAEAVGQRCGKTRQWASDWLNRAAADEEGKLVRTEGRPVRYSLPAQAAGATVAFGPEGIVVTTNTAEHPPVWVDGEEVMRF